MINYPNYEKKKIKERIVSGDLFSRDEFLRHGYSEIDDDTLTSTIISSSNEVNVGVGVEHCPSFGGGSGAGIHHVGLVQLGVEDGSPKA